MVLRIDSNGNVHAMQVPLYDAAGFIPHPLQSIDVVRPGGAINPNNVSGARAITHIMVPGHEFSLSYNFPRRPGT